MNGRNVGASSPTSAPVFTVQRSAAGWSFVDSAGERFFSRGLNHADETNLQYPSNIDIWRKRYGSRDAWITQGVVRDLRNWEFNTVGWTAECVAVGDIDVNDWDAAFDAKHSPQWSRRDHDAAGMPYCVALPVASIEGWNINPQYPDVFSREWEDWCAFVGRSIVLDYADDPNLIGYFLTDVPAWTGHPTGAGFSENGSRGLGAIAEKYYRTVHDAIRSYDPDHLILGDRYNGNRAIPAPVLEAMEPYVDVLSVQYFPEASDEGRDRMREDLAALHTDTGKPVLIADIGNWCATPSNPHRGSELLDQQERGKDYVAALSRVADEPWLIGWHWCAYIENTARGWGLKDPFDSPYDDIVSQITEFNLAHATRVRARTNAASAASTLPPSETADMAASTHPRKDTHA
ncbi:hypothetical protein [Streptomyces chartreusis]|uniref:hypothetical protein n=1 Tax=Streptomyces chartreusis TaxID=1969 RepID=UPI002F90FECD|nr:hypothetical protein OG938_46240 [Streptomyces chartreusis]WTA33488.1 hypothetical protein OIA45_46705 [Streptomyces chartreusis]